MGNVIIIAMASVAGIGLLCALMLAAASKVMSVAADDRVARLSEALPGANCGACGYPGCEGYAEAIANDGAETNLCSPGGNAVIAQLAAIMGVEAGEMAVQAAVVRCGGDNNARKSKMAYMGIRTCAAAKLLYGGQNACAFGCLGFGDCAAACPQDTICIEDGLARVDPRGCTGCKLCLKACPQEIIIMERDPSIAAVLCMNSEKGASVRKKCAKGCIACTKCVKACPRKAIAMKSSLAVIDCDKCDGCGKCAEACITKAIRPAMRLNLK